MCTASELAAFERVDVRTLRAELDAGNVPGAYRRGRSWRIVTRRYLDGLSPMSSSASAGCGERANDGSQSHEAQWTDA